MNPFTHFLSALCLTGGALFAAEEFFPVKITVDAARPIGPLKPIWRFFGADEPNYAYMKDGKKLLGELGELKPKEVFFRTHNLLVTGEGTHALKWGSTNAYIEDAQGNPIYHWTIVDRIFNSYLERGIRPCVQIGGQPKDVGGRVRMGISSQLRNIDNAFAVIARYPEFANTPIVIGESDPEGCAGCQSPNLAYWRILSSEESWRMDWPSSAASKLELLPAERQLIRSMAGHIVAGVASDEETRAFSDFCASLA